MIDWIKFSERQPEKHEIYLIYYGPTVFRGAIWFPPPKYGFFELLLFEEGENRRLKAPQYWAEINPPNETPMPQEKEAPKLCKDCRWVFGKEDLRLYCNHPNANKSYVDGLPCERCDALRQHEDSGPLINEKMKHLKPRSFCGPEGRWWEAKDGACWSTQQPGEAAPCGR